MVYQNIQASLANNQSSEVIEAIQFLAVITPVILSFTDFDRTEQWKDLAKKLILHRHIYGVKGLSLSNDFQLAFELLDYGLPVVFFDFSFELSIFNDASDSAVHDFLAIKESLQGIPRVRIGIKVNIKSQEDLVLFRKSLQHLREICGHFYLECQTLDTSIVQELISLMKDDFTSSGTTIEGYISFSDEVINTSNNSQLIAIATTSERIHLVLQPKFSLLEHERKDAQLLIKHTSTLSLEVNEVADTQEQSNYCDFLLVFLGTIVTDRPDKLITTVVCDENSVCLGLVYSNHQSIRLSFLKQRGVYYSRSRRSLWHKGESSGMHQHLLSMRLDCDRDALKFRVIQCNSNTNGGNDTEACFCHLMRRSCFEGEDMNHTFNHDGFGHLQRTLESRKALMNSDKAVANSYTHKLFNNEQLLRQKLLEEAQELMEAQTQEEVASEAADVFYFMLTRCVQQGVQLHDIQRYLIQRNFKLARRPGHAKEWRTIAAEKALASKSQSSGNVAQNNQI